MISFKIFIRSIGVYSIITLPCLVMPPIYFISLVIAFFYGLIAWVVFAIVFKMTSYFNVKSLTKWLIILSSIPLCISAAYGTYCLINNEKFYEGNEFVVFPIIACISAWIGLYRSRREVEEYFGDPFLTVNRAVN